MSFEQIPPTEWDFATVPWELQEDLLAIGADLRPGTLVSAYCNGLFPMGLDHGGHGEIGWWSPLDRGVLERGNFRLTKSLRKSLTKFTVTFDAAFDDVTLACADPSRSGAWITDAIRQAYSRLHDLGVAHSVEVWSDDELVGGLYGVSFGGLFAGESMFHRATDASKVAFYHLQEAVFADGDARLIDVQWCTDHLASLGCDVIDRDDYLARLPQLLSTSPIAAFES